MKVVRMLPMILMIFSLAACGKVDGGQLIFSSDSKMPNERETAVTGTAQARRESTGKKGEDRKEGSDKEKGEAEPEASDGTVPVKASSGESKTKNTPQAHTHSWTAVTKTVHHDAVTVNEWVVDKAAWDEQVAEEVPVYDKRLVIIATCRGCRMQFQAATQDEAVKNCHRHIIDVHDNMCGYGLEDSYWEQVRTGTKTEYRTVHHDEQGHYETRTVRQAYDETTAAGYRCTGCGAIR